MKKRISILMCMLLNGLVILISCSKDNQGQSNDNFDRNAMLQNWADNIIVPGYTSYVSKLTSLNSSANIFTNTPSLENLENLREAWLSANISWQQVALFEIGKAEELSLISYTNIYPTNTKDMMRSIENGTFDLGSVNKQDEQGFPAIEYLIYGIKDTDGEIIDLYLQEMKTQFYGDYLVHLTNRLKTLTQSVLSDWENDYRDQFVNNDRSESTSSVNKLINDYIFYYEKHMRAGKIGIPAGVFSGEKHPKKVEGLYSGKSKELFMAGFDAMQNFFNGKHFSTKSEGKSLKSYLEFIQRIREGEDIANLINVQFDVVREKTSVLSDDFSEQVKNNNSLMLKTYDELQRNVMNLKVDMLQALNIRVDFVDADGD